MAHGSRRAAALAALCLLSLAAGASAACTPGYLKLDLVGTAGTGASSHEFAKCLSSLKINLDAGCDITLESLSFGGAYVPDMWSSTSAPSYASFAECRQFGAKVTSADETSAVLIAAVKDAFSFFPYGSTKAVAMDATTPVDFATGGVVVIKTDAAAQTFTYAITESTLASADVTKLDADAVIVSNAVTVTAAAANGAVSPITTACDTTGRYGFVVGSIKVCALCPTGTTGDGVGCTACTAGKASASVGATSCTDCLAGTYASAGTSNCQPCPMHTYSTAAAASCTTCPTNSYAWIPGSTGCVRCSAGIPRCIAGAMNSATCTNTGTASDGYHVLDVTSQLTCALANSYLPPATTICTTWKTVADPTVKLSLHVKGDCSIVVSPITEEACADPFKTDYTGSRTYSQLQMRAYYQTLTTIRSLLPSASTGYSSSYMLAIDADSGINVGLKFWAASNDPAQADDVVLTANDVCTTTVAVTGGQVAGLPTTADEDCPVGSYQQAGAYCPPCPTGNYCLGGTGAEATKVACAADTYNSFLGQTAAAACDACDPGDDPAGREAAVALDANAIPTSLAGAYSCTIPYVRVKCGDGKEYEPASQKCIDCKAGTARAATSDEGCLACAAGEYSAAGATSCEACPIGEYGPSLGLADQNPGDNAKAKCLVCPAGSLAVQTDALAASILPGGTVLALGATKCLACPEGHYMSSTTALCTVCAIDTYRSGDATPENNECLSIPAGYYASSGSDTAVTAIAPCAAGSISYYASNDRVPNDLPQTCKPCSEVGLNTYAPRIGMANCLPCDGGTEPASSNTQCAACAADKFRSFSSATAACATCTAGAEVGPSGRQACTQCLPGTYKAASGDSAGLDFCSDCLEGTYSPLSGATTCLSCPPGSEAVSKGNSECTPCSSGYYNPTAGAACVAAPAGSYVNTSEATAFSACSVGTFSTEAGIDQCDPCPPGQFTNVPGSKSCRTCPAGTFALGQAATCSSCRAGFFAPAGAATCSACKPGTFSKTTRSATCSLCPAGSQCSGIATTAPTLCPKGYVAPKEGSKLCTPCPVNTFQDNEGRTVCTPCAVGTSTRGQVGQSVCQATRPASLRRSMA